ncbi:MAG: hypothetical protein ACRELA_05790 [Candidatus Rokuibacteriota bacterium]
MTVETVDEFMLRFHRFLKEHDGYPLDVDGVHGHGESRRLERSVRARAFIVARASLVLPDRAPIAILERLAGAKLS